VSDQDDALDAAHRQAEYDRMAQLLWACAELRDQHTAETPECGGEPLCIGEDALALLAIEFGHSAGPARRLSLAAIGELSRMRRELLAGMDSLADAFAKAMRLDADLTDTRGELADTRERLTAAETEMEWWNASADLLGPVHRIGGEES
jgi:hypothetical protein